MSPCRKCGGEVRLAHMRVSFNRKRGMGMWIEHISGDDEKCCDGTKGWEWTKWRSDKSKPSETDKMLTKWEAHP